MSLDPSNKSSGAMPLPRASRRRSHLKVPLYLIVSEDDKRDKAKALYH